MIDKVLQKTHIALIVTISLLASGCGFDRPLKKPTPVQAKVLSPISENGESPFLCADNLSVSPKGVAILQVGVAHPEQTRLFPHFQQLFSKRLLEKAQQSSKHQIHDVTHITLQSDEVSLLGKVSSDMNHQVREIGKQFNSQLVVHGTISQIEQSQKDRSYADKDDHLLDNISDVMARISDKLSNIAWRNVTFRLQVFNGTTGDLILESETEQKISLQTAEPHFLLTSPSERQKDEQRMLATIDSLIDRQMAFVDDAAFCTPVRGKVLASDNQTATINIGANSKVRVGDYLELFQSRLIDIDSRGIEHVEENKVGLLRVTAVQSDSATGKIEQLSRTTEIQKGDLVLSY
ncbi:MAG: hypothetical protein OQK13_04360 [Gammaproteobacteria bacterium]|nr:hypothetical protein [Gammaproteobacteria bacterium]